MIITRIIHPIGQGGFYTENFSNGNHEIKVVYDCGGFDRYGQKKMQRYLDSYLEGNKKEIEAVFVSHFHADHINGLQYLLDNAKVNYVFLPQLTDEVVIEAFVYNYCMTRTNNRINHFLVDLYNKVKPGNKENTPRILQIEEANDVQGMPDDLVFEGRREDGLTLRFWDFHSRSDIEIPLSQKIIRSGIGMYCDKWLYIPFNSQTAPEKRKELKKELEKKLGHPINVENLPKLHKVISVKDCKKIYDGVFKKQHNTYSMTLFSGLMDWRNSRIIRSYMCEWCDCDCYYNYRMRPTSFCWNPNFLYTGDFEPNKDYKGNANISALKSFYRPVWDKIASIQVPHHGSKNNYHEDLYVNPIRGLVSVGTDNSYHHPDISTLMKMQSQGCQPIMVTEDKNTMKIYCYKIC